MRKYKLNWIVNEIDNPIIVAIIGIAFYFTIGIIMHLCIFYYYQFFSFDRGYKMITSEEAEKRLDEMEKSLALSQFVVIPSISVITGFIVGLLSNKKAWLLGLIVALPWSLMYFIGDFSKIPHRLIDIEELFYSFLLPLFLCSFSSHLSCKLKIWLISKIKNKLKDKNKVVT